MFTIAVVARKGGSGKTTACINLVGGLLRSSKKEIPNIGICDMDPQGTLAEWFTQRKEQQGITDAPYYLALSLDNLHSDIEEAEKAGFDYVVIDTAPARGDELADIIDVADFVLVTCKATPADLDAVSDTVRTVRAANKPFAFNVSMAKRGTNLLTQALTILSQIGPIAGVTHDRIAFSEMVGTGQTVHEYDPSGKGCVDVNNLKIYVQKYQRDQTMLARLRAILCGQILKLPESPALAKITSKYR